MSTGNTYAPAYLVAEKMYWHKNKADMRWDELSIFERNQYVNDIKDVFHAMEQVGIAVPKEKMRRK